MLQLRISDSVEKFRAELVAWLGKNPPPIDDGDSSLEAFVSRGSSWQRTLAAGKWLGVHWPAEFGGRGLSLVEEAVIQEELVRVNSPQVLGLFGLTMVGPVLIKHGNPEQKTRFLQKILTGEEIWCQGFSEPGAGSDLAAIKTKAVPTQGGFLVTGQKIWTSFAHIAKWCFALCRTDDSGKRHEGLSYLLIPMDSKGITVRSLQQISGDREFNEVFFDSVFVDHKNVVGKVGDGWNIAISTLMHERVVLTFARQLQSEVVLRKLVSERKSIKSEAYREELARCVVECCATRALAYEHLMAYAKGKEPGPEGSLDKLFWSESFQRLSKLAMNLRGQCIALGEGSTEAGSDVHRYLYSRGRTIAAGTSEVQRNIIAERVLNLPRLKYSTK